MQMNRNEVKSISCHIFPQTLKFCIQIFHVFVSFSKIDPSSYIVPFILCFQYYFSPCYFWKFVLVCRRLLLQWLVFNLFDNWRYDEKKPKFIFCFFKNPFLQLVFWAILRTKQVRKCFGILTVCLYLLNSFFSCVQNHSSSENCFF